MREREEGKPQSRGRTCRVCGGNPGEPSLPAAKSTEMCLDKRVGARSFFNTAPLDLLPSSQCWHTTSPRPRSGAPSSVPVSLYSKASQNTSLPKTRAPGRRVGHVLRNFPKADCLLAHGVLLVPGFLSPNPWGDPP